MYISGARLEKKWRQQRRGHIFIFTAQLGLARLQGRRNFEQFGGDKFVCPHTPPLIKIGLTNPPKYGEDLSLLPLVRTCPHVLIPSGGTSTSSLHTFSSKSILFFTVCYV